MKLRTPLRAVSAGVLVLGLGFIAVGTAGASTPRTFNQWGHRQALFVETDASSGNSVLSYRQATDGTISYAGTYATGGLGATSAGASADPLASQGGLALANDGANLIATNPGSDTVTVFSVDGTHLNVEQQLPSGGLFPDSIATSGRLVSVLNAGGAGAVAEFEWFNGHLVPLAGQVRSLGLSNTTPPEFHHGAGEVAYTPDGQHLIVTTKLSTNAYDVFSVGANGALGAAPVVTTSVNALPFSFTFDAAGNVVGGRGVEQFGDDVPRQRQRLAHLARYRQRRRRGTVLDLGRERRVLRFERGQRHDQLLHGERRRRTRSS